MRKDQNVTKRFNKDQEFENVLKEMNNLLYEKQKDLLLTDLKERFSTIHIIGAPRSGTTLISQLLSSGLNLGYINNLSAAFWKAPIFGIHLSKKLIEHNYKSNFKSEYGRTSNIEEPHEFGYFWNYHLKYDDFEQKNKKHEELIAWDELKIILLNMTELYQKPLVFKSFLLGFHASTLFKYLKKTIFIYVKRDFIDNATSILKLRKELVGSEEKWASIRPKQYQELKDLNKYYQIAGQLIFLEHEYLKELKNIPDENKIFVRYEDLCKDPKIFLNECKTKIEYHNGIIEDYFDNVPDSFKINKFEKNKIEVGRLLKAKNDLESKNKEFMRY